MKNYFDKKIIWITGGTSGIGMSLSKEFLSKCSRIVISGRRSITELTNSNEEFIETIQSDHISYYICDVSDTNNVNNTYKSIVNNVGVPDVLINNAGIGIFKSFLDTSIGEFNAMMNTNIRGAFNTTKVMLPDMIKLDSGMIVNITSVATQEKFPKSSIYAASKSAMLTMSRILREEIRDKNIKIIDVIPGATATPIWDTNILAKHEDRMMKSDDVAKFIINMLEASVDSTVNIEEILIKPRCGNL